MTQLPKLNAFETETEVTAELQEAWAQMNSPKLVARLLAVSLLLCLTGCAGFSTSQKLTIAPPASFSVAVNPSSATVAKGGSTTVSASVAAQGSFTGTVQLSLFGVPSGVTASLSSSTITGSGDPTISISASSGVAAGTYTVAVTGMSGTVAQTATFSLAVTTTSTTADFSLSTTPNTQTIAVGQG